MKKLGNMALASINGLINELLDSVGREKGAITNVVIVGNTTMTHLLFKLEPRYIRRTPYVPIVSEFPILKGGEIGLKVNPMAAVFTLPGPASYVGGDIVSGIIYFKTLSGAKGPSMPASRSCSGKWGLSSTTWNASLIEDFPSLSGLSLKTAGLQAQTGYEN